MKTCTAIAALLACVCAAILLFQARDSRLSLGLSQEKSDGPSGDTRFCVTAPQPDSKFVSKSAARNGLCSTYREDTTAGSADTSPTRHRSAMRHKSGFASNRAKLAHTESFCPSADAHTEQKVIAKSGKADPLAALSKPFANERLPTMPAAIFETADDSSLDPATEAGIQAIADEFVSVMENSGLEPDSLEYIRLWNLQQLIADTRYKTRYGGHSWMKQHLASRTLAPPDISRTE